MKGLQYLKDELSKDLYGKTTDQAIDSGLCIQCNQPAIPIRCYSEAGIKEFYISGLCEICFDEITKE